MIKENKEQKDKSSDNSIPPLYEFASKVYGTFKQTPFHESYYRILNEFAKGKVRKLIVSVPPQHGKSLGSSVLLPAYMLGLNPNNKIAIASYSSALASRFNRRVQRLLDTEKYGEVFPNTTIKSVGARSEYQRTASQVEIIDHAGELFSIGREGALTGNEVDIFILDDLYKDAMEANSPIIRDNCWEWYTSVVKTRMHNNSQELIVFTRWHEEDLIGSVLEKEPHVKLERWEQIDDLDPSHWLVVNFEAIKDTPTTEVDPRMEGEVLWEKRHSRKLLLEKRALDAFRFNCMYQGRPSIQDGLLYGQNIGTYDKLPTNIVKKGNYTDTADLGDDYLCSISYDVCKDGLIYVTDVVYSRERMEITESLVANLLTETQTRVAYVESNNGGRGFARAVGRLAPAVRIEWFHQSDNKEARILSNSATVLRNLIMPKDWQQRWGDFYSHVVNYRRLFRANRWHDAADVLTGIVEKEVVASMGNKIKRYVG